MGRSWIIPLLILPGILPGNFLGHKGTDQQCSAHTDKPPLFHLTAVEAQQGWLLLFDGHSAFGWHQQGRAAISNGVWTLEAGSLLWPTTSRWPSHAELVVEAAGPFRLFVPQNRVLEHHREDFSRLTIRWTPREIQAHGEHFRTIAAVERPHATAGASLAIQALGPTPTRVRQLRLWPRQLQPLFNGKNLDGWTVNTADPKRRQGRFSLTPQGELLIENGPGDLVSTTVADNFILQLQCRTLGHHLNGGIFFRCIPGQYQNGYEVQIHNGYKNNDRTQPLDFGTGAIYRRAPVRRVVGDDDRWVTITLIADGRHLATWVDGYPVVDWTDPRPPHDNPRQGYRAAAGPFSLQAHDPTTRLLFRRIEYAPLPTTPQ
jgi:hypothetical protein